MLEGREQLTQKNWWAAVWRGLVVDSRGRHCKAMRSALCLFIYLIIHADRKTGQLTRRYETIARDMGVRPRTVRHWMAVLRNAGYIRIEHGRGHALLIQIEKWKPFASAHR